MTSTIAPPQTGEQRLAALARANEIRLLRAQVKRDIRSREIQAWPLIDEPPAELLTMKVYDLLLAMPKFGAFKVSALLRQHAISTSKTVGGLSDRQRAALVEWLRSRT